MACFLSHTESGGGGSLVEGRVWERKGSQQDDSGVKALAMQASRLGFCPWSLELKERTGSRKLSSDLCTHAVILRPRSPSLSLIHLPPSLFHIHIHTNDMCKSNV